MRMAEKAAPVLEAVFLGGAAVRFGDGQIVNPLPVGEADEGSAVLVAGGEIKIGAAHGLDAERFEPVDGFVEHGAEFLRIAQALKPDAHAFCWLGGGRLCSWRFAFPGSHVS